MTDKRERQFYPGDESQRKFAKHPDYEGLVRRHWSRTINRLLIAYIRLCVRFFLRSVQLLDRTSSRVGEKRAPTGLVVDLLTPPTYAEEALINILTRYDYWIEKHGRRRANLIFHVQCLGAVLSCWTDWLMKRIKLLQFLRHS